MDVCMYACAWARVYVYNKVCVLHASATVPQLKKGYLTNHDSYDDTN